MCHFFGLVYTMGNCSEKCVNLLIGNAECDSDDDGIELAGRQGFTVYAAQLRNCETVFNLTGGTVGFEPVRRDAGDDGFDFSLDGDHSPSSGSSELSRLKKRCLWVHLDSF